MQREKTAQERFWEGAFGTDYTERNVVAPDARIPFWQHILAKLPPLQSVCELGANRGHNLQALHQIDSALNLTGVEPNPDAYRLLTQQAFIQAYQASIQTFEPGRHYDLVFTCGVLIHVAPADLPAVHHKLFALSRRYILINEYFSPVPVELPYRGHAEKLFKRDFAGELMDCFPNQLAVVETGFLWKRMHPAWDDTTWFLLEKIV